MKKGHAPKAFHSLPESNSGPPVRSQNYGSKKRISFTEFYNSVQFLHEVRFVFKLYCMSSIPSLIEIQRK
jgi:hypothetical protein